MILRILSILADLLVNTPDISSRYLFYHVRMSCLSDNYPHDYTALCIIHL